MNDDLTLSLSSLSIAGSTTLHGNQLGIGSDGFAISGTSTSVTVNDALTLSQPSTPFMVAASGVLTVRGVISGPGGLLSGGAGVANLMADNAYTGDTTVSDGTLEIDGTQPGSAVVVTGGRLQGGGSVGPLTVTDDGVVAPIQAAAPPPGDAPCPRELTVDGDFVMSPTSTLEATLNMNCVTGSNFDQNSYSNVFVNGNATVGGHFVIAPGAWGQADVCVVSASGSLSGTFAGLPDESVVPVMGDWGAGVWTYSHYVQDPLPNYGCQAHADQLVFPYYVTITHLTSSANPSAQEQPVTLSAALSYPTDYCAPSWCIGSPWGSVDFYVDGTLEGTAPTTWKGNDLSVASYTVSDLPAGSHDVLAVFRGNSPWECSSSSDSGLVCGQTPTSAAVRLPARDTAAAGAHQDLSSSAHLVQSVTAATHRSTNPSVPSTGLWSGAGGFSLGLVLSLGGMALVLGSGEARRRRAVQRLSRPP